MSAPSQSEPGEGNTSKQVWTDALGGVLRCKGNRTIAKRWYAKQGRLMLHQDVQWKLNHAFYSEAHDKTVAKAGKGLGDGHGP